MPTIAPSRGTHVTLAQADLPLRAGAIVPAGEGRSIFALPWLGRSADRDDRQQLRGRHRPRAAFAVGHRVLARREQTRSSVRASGQISLPGAYAGVRPLISSGDSRKSVDISRKAELYETSSGLITITGGKLTTWRRMAKLAVDRIVERDGRTAPCRTHEIPLGAADRRRRAAPGRGRARGVLRSPRRCATATPPRRCCCSRPNAASWLSRSSPGFPIYWSRPRTPRGTSRRARSRTSCSDGPGSDCLPAASCPPRTARCRCAWRGRLGPSSVGTSGASSIEVESFRRGGRSRGHRREIGSPGDGRGTRVLPSGAWRWRTCGGGGGAGWD